MKKRFWALVCALSITAQPICGSVSVDAEKSVKVETGRESSDKATTDKGNSRNGKIHEVKEKTKFKHLSKEKKMAINDSVNRCEKDGKKAAEKMNQMKEDKTEFQIGVRKALDRYYSLDKSERTELEEFEKNIDDSAEEILYNYEEAEEERDNAENLPFEVAKVLITFEHGTPMETIQTIIGNEAVSYEVLCDGERHIPENLPEYKKKRLEKGKDIKRDILILADITLEDTVERAIEKIEAYECVKYVSDNTYFEQDGTITTTTGGITYSATSEDPNFTEKRSWNMKSVDVPRAWNKFKTVGELYPVWVAVIDSGVQMNHPDLKNILLRDLSVDVTQNDKPLVKCLDIVHKEGQYTEAHGTRVAGLIMAQANNDAFSAGIASIGSVAKHRNFLRLMAIKCDASTGGRHVTRGYLDEAIYYAVDSGAEVINISFSAPKENYVDDEYSELQDAMEYAVRNGVTVVCSAGNDTSTTLRYPAAFGINKNKPAINGIIGVGATRKDGTLAEYTNESNAVEIVAPGGSNNSNYAQIYTTSSTTINPNGYIYGVHGTSYATPLVTGTVAMMYAINSSLTPAQLEKRLVERTTVTAKGRITSKTFKVLNAGLAVEKMVEN